MAGMPPVGKVMIQDKSDAADHRHVEGGDTACQAHSEHGTQQGMGCGCLQPDT